MSGGIRDEDYQEGEGMKKKRICPSCKLVELNFTEKPMGGVTAWCWVCSQGYYLRSGRVHDIVIRCSRIGGFVPAYRCRECEKTAGCLREMMRKPIITKLPIFKVKPPVVVHG